MGYPCVSFEAAAWAIHQSPRTAHEKLVLIVLADHYNKNNSRCDPSISRMAEMCLCSERQVKRAIQSLEQQGFIQCERTLGMRTRYTLNQCHTVTSDSPSPVTHSPEPVTHSHPTSDSQSPEPVINQEVTKSMSKVFDYWTLKFSKPPQTKFTNDRKAKVMARLKEGYSMEDICKAIDGCANSPHHMGKNDTGTVYNDLTLICRTGSKLEQFMAMADQKKHEPMSRAERAARAAV